ncbi:MAG: cobalt-precorrin-5B (C(1))-methyltransferase [Nitrospiraceae bacterium]
MGNGSAPPSRKGMRTGFTTGACATAATKAALQALLTGMPSSEVTITLPAGRDVTFTTRDWVIGETEAACGIIKDAGDDPDVTHGAVIRATVRWRDEPGLVLVGGEGVGTVTRPGLGLEIGGPAINPVPRRMLTAVVEELLGQQLHQRGLLVTLSIPGGEQLAKKTLNGRLGIVEGLSILGTTGIVRPYSTAAWRASVVQAVDVAAAGGCHEVVLSTGGTTERFAIAVRRDLAEIAFIEMGIFTGAALKACARVGIERVVLSGQVGKFSKIAQGFMQTHAAGTRVDTHFLGELAARYGASGSLREAIVSANTARHVGELVLAVGAQSILSGLCEEVVQQCRAYVQNRLDVGAMLFDFDGTLLASVAAGACPVV